MAGKRQAAATLLACGAVAVGSLAACGTRLPNTAFVKAQQQQAGVGTAVGGGGTGNSGGDGNGAGNIGGSGGGDGTGPGGSSNVGGGNGNAGNGAGPGASTGPQSKNGKGNFASAPGVTASTITIGNISSRTNPFDPRAFVGPLYGIEAFVRYTNAHGGIHGRKLVLKTCDDQGDGSTNVNCVQQLVNSEHVFALVSNAILNYQGAAEVNSAGVPDIGSQPISTAYDQYPHLWDLYGETYPRTGKFVGDHGKLTGGTEVYRYFKVKYPKVALKAGVVEYNQGDSERFGQSIVNGLQHEGYQVTEKTVNFALPDFDSVAQSFKSAGVKYVYDTIDREGNVRLCQALQDNNVPIFAKVVTTQSWEQSVNSDYSSARTCANEMWTYGNTRNFEDTQYPQVNAFRRQMSADGTGSTNDLSEWALEGWAGGLWFSDASASCGAKLTRSCVEAYMNRKTFYDGHGLLIPRRFEEISPQPSHIRNCINMAHWSVSADKWVTMTPDMDHDCFVVPNLSYSP